MSHLRAAVALDTRVQARSRLYAIGVIVAVIMGVAVRIFFPAGSAGRVMPAFFLLGLGGTTYMFGASMILLEKSERTLEALRVSPLTRRTYVASKVLTLTGFATLEAAIVYAIAAAGVTVSPLPLIAGVLILGVAYTLVGIGQAAAHDSITRFLMPGAMIVIGVLQLPFLYVLDIGAGGIFYLIPTQAPLLLMLGAFEPLASWQWIYAVVVSVVGLWAAGVYARMRFRKHIRLPES